MRLIHAFDFTVMALLQTSLTNLRCGLKLGPEGGSFFSYYMYHGGTNFGRTACNSIATSYGYDAPIDEYGNRTLCREGMDAQVAYGFHQLHDEKPHLAQSAIANKVGV
ncbi:uncharacterized protein M6B38_267070 [Iris pallida]|uniref:beta-galactosidase n=1 Tax=Iris pallida TaxID=29817 RepID=A0AAX6I9A3_IRIPA|nr:uncharacterized protein M6B38_267070 [Iris pallida]